MITRRVTSRGRPSGMLAASTVRSISTPHLSSRLHNAVRRADSLRWFSVQHMLDLLRVVANPKESQRTGITQLSFFGQPLRSRALARRLEDGHERVRPILRGSPPEATGSRHRRRSMGMVRSSTHPPLPHPVILRCSSPPAASLEGWAATRSWPSFETRASARLLRG